MTINEGRGSLSPLLYIDVDESILDYKQSDVKKVRVFTLLERPKDRFSLFYHALRLSFVLSFASMSCLVKMPGFFYFSKLSEVKHSLKRNKQ